ncbi:hypothetical protein FEM48_Zijuj12G0170800 [Ziziphus jujuba var. spinosa]|uniref:Uncharacterized protein n=1 Tax=Ziziphus jujuba var. spinosa TaxID=714518 RepID=A0A978UEK4_ZIZJJ|nr:hypothetical protein FEM48_Zijuj12G0170800 [Ziziphus jujuba var. spinosa]
MILGLTFGCSGLGSLLSNLVWLIVVVLLVMHLEVGQVLFVTKIFNCRFRGQASFTTYAKSSGFWHKIVVVASFHHQPNVFVMLIFGLNMYDQVDSHLDAKPYCNWQSGFPKGKRKAGVCTKMVEVTIILQTLLKGLVQRSSSSAPSVIGSLSLSLCVSKPSAANVISMYINIYIGLVAELNG